MLKRSHRALGSVPASLAIVALLAIPVVEHGRHRVPRRAVVSPPTTSAAAARATERANAEVAASTEMPITAAASPAAPVVAPTTTAPPVMPPTPAKVMLIGDSMAYTAGLGLAPLASQYGFTVANEGISGCGVVRGGPYRYFGAVHTMEPRCEEWPAAWADAVARNHPDLVAIEVGRWEVMDRVHDGQWTNIFDPTFAAYVESEIDQGVQLAASTGARVAVFTSPYYLRGTPPGGGIFPEDDPSRVDAINSILRAVAARRGAMVIDVGARLSPEGHYTADVDGNRVRSDGVHLTRAAGALLAPVVFPALQQLFLAPTPPAPQLAAPPNRLS